MREHDVGFSDPDVQKCPKHTVEALVDIRAYTNYPISKIEFGNQVSRELQETMPFSPCVGADFPRPDVVNIAVMNV